MPASPLKQVSFAEANSLLRKMIALQPANFGYDGGFWIHADDFERQFFMEFVASNYETTIKAMMEGYYNHPEIYNNLRSSRLSIKDVSTLVSTKIKEIPKYVAKLKRRGNPNGSPPPRKLRAGEIYEHRAMELYQQRSSFTIRSIRHIINPTIPFLIGQIDGIAFKGNQPSHIIEIKSLNQPDLDKLFGKYERSFTKTKDGYQLNKNSIIYHQLQLSMFLTNLQWAHLVIYRPPEDRIVLVLEVPRDDNYLKSIIRNISDKYPKLLSEYTKVVKYFL